MLRRPKAAVDPSAAAAVNVRATFSGTRPKSIMPTAEAAEATLRPRNSNATAGASGTANGRLRPTTVYDAGGPLAPVTASASAAVATADPAFKRTATQSKLPKELRGDKEKEVRGAPLSRTEIRCPQMPTHPSWSGARRGTVSAQNKAAVPKETEKNPLSAEARAVMAQFVAKSFTEEYGTPCTPHPRTLPQTWLPDCRYNKDRRWARLY